MGDTSKTKINDMTNELYHTNNSLPSTRLSKASSGHQRETCTLFFRGEHYTKTITDERLRSLCKQLK